MRSSYEEQNALDERNKISRSLHAVRLREIAKKCCNNHEGLLNIAAFLFALQPGNVMAASILSRVADELVAKFD